MTSVFHFFLSGLRVLGVVALCGALSAFALVATGLRLDPADDTGISNNDGVTFVTNPFVSLGGSGGNRHQLSLGGDA